MATGRAEMDARVRTVTSNNALVSDVCAAALRAFYNAPQRGR
jgi:hypothetical protein